MAVLIGIDVGGSSIKVGATDLKGTIVSTAEVPVNIQDPISSLLALKNTLKQLADGEKIVAVGLAVPGPLDIDAGILRAVPNLPGWSNFPIYEKARDIFGVPVIVENDANAAAYGENLLGAAMGSRMTVMVTIGTGIGGGIVADGRIIHGAHGSASEIGHITVEQNGLLCACGKHGCLETVANSRALQRIYSELTNSSKTVEVRSIVNDAVNGIQPAVLAVGRIGDYIGFALGGVATTLNPDCIVIGGGVSLVGESLIERIREKTIEHTMPTMRKGLIISGAKLGNNAGFLGAALLARELVK